MQSSSFSNFAKASAYTAPPDHSNPMSSTPTRPAFPAHQSSNFVSPQSGPSGYASTSYQAGGIPDWGNSAGSGGSGGFGYDAEGQEGRVNEWETRFGWRVDVIAATAYLGGPITALIFLILETHSDYIRFHSYQSALLTTPLILLRLFLGLIHFPGFFLTLLTLIIVGSILFMAYRAFRDANQGSLERYHLPFIGEFADRWVGEE
ncbi:hypothetical protein FS837_005970 [Tulasnella sp. UAMH 9824]|nr:hypothetical protein FS837_005970 [Tulasnella sp. UAMH 9824]